MKFDAVLISFLCWIIQSFRRATAIIGFAAILCVTSHSFGARWYVDASATGVNDGSGWTDAFTSLQSALTAAFSNDEVWVAYGVYKPSALSEAGQARSATFKLADNVKLFGGFAGTETSLIQRNPHVQSPPGTILSGDIGTVSDDSDNSWHVVLIQSPSTAGEIDEDCQFDGFVVTNGNADGTTNLRQYGGGLLVAYASPVIQNCTFIDNKAGTAGGGGGAHVHGVTNVGSGLPNASPTFRSCAFLGNESGNEGGGLCNLFDDCSLVNCVFSGNTADDTGGGVVSFGSQGQAPVLNVVNCTFSKNAVTGTAGGGGGIFTNQIFNVVNSLFWDNTAPGDDDLDFNVNFATINYSTAEDNSLNGVGTGNNATNPNFEDADGADNTPGTNDDNLRLPCGSPAINSGDTNSAVIPTDLYGVDDDGTTTGEPTPDRDRKDRLAVPTVGTAVVDRGAYERPLTATACDADMNSDGFIGIADLLAVIGAWGACTGCPEDFVPAPCGDGNVGIADLLGVIGLWGAQCTAAGWAGPPDDEGMPQDINDCMEMAEEAGDVGSDRYNMVLDGCIQRLCEEELIDCD